MAGRALRTILNLSRQYLTQHYTDLCVHAGLVYWDTVAQREGGCYVTAGLYPGFRAQ